MSFARIERPSLHIKNLSKSFYLASEKLEVLFDVGLDVPGGSFVSVIDRGSEKTPRRGEISGDDANRDAEERSNQKALADATDAGLNVIEQLAACQH